jgi:hypothetical protein
LNIALNIGTEYCFTLWWINLYFVHWICYLY